MISNEKTFVEVDEQQKTIVIHYMNGALSRLPPTVRTALETALEIAVIAAEKLVPLLVQIPIRAIGLAIEELVVGIETVKDRIRRKQIDRMVNEFVVEMAKANVYRSEPLRKSLQETASHKFLTDMAKYAPQSVTVQELVASFN